MTYKGLFLSYHLINNMATNLYGTQQSNIYKHNETLKLVWKRLIFDLYFPPDYITKQVHLQTLWSAEHDVRECTFLLHFRKFIRCISNWSGGASSSWMRREFIAADQLFITSKFNCAHIGIISSTWTNRSWTNASKLNW